MIVVSSSLSLPATQCVVLRVGTEGKGEKLTTATLLGWLFGFSLELQQFREKSIVVSVAVAGA